MTFALYLASSFRRDLIPKICHYARPKADVHRREKETREMQGSTPFRCCNPTRYGCLGVEDVQNGGRMWRVLC
jgi:hypothetical protein